MKIHQSKDADSLSQSLADWLVSDIQKTLKEKDNYSFVLSGGSTPKGLYQLLASTPRKEQIEWEKLHFYMGDERYVPFEDERHNGKMAYDTLLNHVPVNEENIHLMDTTLKPDESAIQYANLLHQQFKESNTTFDFVLLGMGDDGHTLSLFPGTSVIHEKEKWVTAPFVEKQDMYRITLTRSVVQKATNIAFMISGQGKAHALQKVIEGDYQPDTYPAQTIKKDNPNVLFFIDQAAASDLS